MADINISSTNSSDIFGKLFLSAIIFLILGAGVGIAIDKFLLTPNVKPTSTKNAENLPKTINVTSENVVKTCANYFADPTKVMTSPLFTEWLGSVEGKVVEKNADSFTLEKDGSRLKIYLQKSLTLFMGDFETPGKRKKLTFDQIPVGTTLRGGVTISRGTLTNDVTQHIFADGFIVVNETKK